METNDVYQYVITEEANYKIMRIPVTTSKDWNMHEHIERCTNVANAWFHKGYNDGLRPYKDIVTPILNVAFRSEGFDVKDIVPFVNDSENFYKSFLVKKFHPQWARRNDLDTFIDDLVETSIIYDLALVKNLNNARPEVVKLQSIAFCDQTDVLGGPLCLKHQYSVADLLDFKGIWDDNKIDEAILMAQAVKAASSANDQQAKTPGKYIEVYELHGMLPDSYLEDESYMVTEGAYTNQLHIITFYVGGDGKRKGITLYKGKSKPIGKLFKALKIDRVKSFGRACGRSIIEQLFEPQVWTNYSEIKIKAMLDAAAVNLLQTDSEEFGNQRLDNLKNNYVLKHEPGRPITALDTAPRNLPAFTNHQKGLEDNARTIGSANDAQLGVNPSSGTPFALENFVAQQGQGIHEYRQGKIATFVSDELYRDWILGFLVKEMNNGKEFSEELSFDEMQEISTQIATNAAEKQMKEMMLQGKIVTQEAKDQIIKFKKDEFMKGGNRKFFKALQGELKDLPIDVYVNISGKQKNLAKNADAISKIISQMIANPMAFQQMPGLGKVFNQLIEDSGLDPIDFSQITDPAPSNPQQNNQPIQPQSDQPIAPVKKQVKNSAMVGAGT